MGERLRDLDSLELRCDEAAGGIIIAGQAMAMVDEQWDRMHHPPPRVTC